MYVVSLNTHSSPLGRFRDVKTEESVILPKVTQLEDNLGLPDPMVRHKFHSIVFPWEQTF